MVKGGSNGVAVLETDACEKWEKRRKENKKKEKLKRNPESLI